MSTDETKIDHAREQAAAQFAAIKTMLTAEALDWGRLEELRGEVRHYVAGWNMPGYMPDAEPQPCEDADDARAVLVEAMRTHSDERGEYPVSAGDVRTVQELRAAADELAAIPYDRNAPAGYTYGRTIGGLHYWIAYDSSPTAGLSEADADELRELEESRGEYDSQEDAEEAISSDPLSVEVRSGWTAPGEELQPKEFCILLCTGGPAVRIVGDLDEHGTPTRARLEYQDWGTPWIEYGPALPDVLADYASRFFG